MKRSWIGFGLLIALLILGVLTTRFMSRIHEGVSEDLAQAAEWVILGDWENSLLFFHRAKEDWKSMEHIRACFADHNPVEEIDASFALLEVYGQMRENAAFAAGCKELARKTAAVGEAHELVWWNLL